MNVENKHEQNVVLSEDVIAKIVGVSASEIKGVCGLASSPDFRKLFASKESKSVNVRNADGTVAIDLFIKLATGVNIKSVCSAVQENVKKAVQNMTGQVVSQVNVYVADIDIPYDE